MSTQSGPLFDLETHWLLDAEPEELTAIVLDADMIARWAPRVFMHATLIERGAVDGLGMTVRLHTKGLLPHSFLFTARIGDLVPHRWMRIDVSGDFEGSGNLEVEPRGDGRCDARLRWTIHTAHPYLKPVVSLLKPVLAWNHRWAMRSMRCMMQAEVMRRRSPGSPMAAPAPTFPHNLAFVGKWQRRNARRTQPSDRVKTPNRQPVAANRKEDQTSRSERRRR